MDRRLLQTAHQPSHRTARGQTLVIFALFLVVLVTAMALGVDGARFYAEGLRVQRAADEAALAAVVHAGNGNTVAAQTAAQEMATRNLPPGVTPVVDTAVSAVPVNQVRVQVTENHYPFLFAPIFGLKSGTITREATAQYNAPVPMGNPSNTLGDIWPGTGDRGDIQTYQPGPLGTPGSGTAPFLHQHMVLSINGPDQWLESGDPYSPRYVLSDCPFVNYGARCQGALLPNTPDPRIMTNPYNSDGSFSGYKYRVTIPSGTPSSAITYIQVYDAETCAGNFNDSVLSSQYGVPWAGTSESSNGPNYNAATDGPVRTYFGLDYLDPTTGQAVAMSGAPVHSDPNLPTGLTGVPADTVIAPSDNCSDAANGLTFKNQWYTLAEVSGSGTYIVTASTCPTAASNNAVYTSTSGSVYYKCHGTEVNNFVLRAVTEPNTTPCITGANSGADVIDCQSFTSSTITPELAGLGRISIEVNSAGTTPIYLANIDPIYQGKWLLVKLYDPGDLYGGSSLQIVRPDGTYAPFEWYTQTVDASGKTFETGLQNFSGNASLITSFSTGYPAPYTTPSNYNTADPSTDLPGPVAPACGQPMAPATYLPPAAPAYGQTMAEEGVS